MANAVSLIVLYYNAITGSAIQLTGIAFPTLRKLVKKVKFLAFYNFTIYFVAIVFKHRENRSPILLLNFIKTHPLSLV